MTASRLSALARRQSTQLRVHAQQRPVRIAGRFLYGVVAAFLLAVMIYLVVKTHENPRIVDGCPTTSSALPDRLLLVLAIVALLVGRFLGFLRYDPNWKTPAKPWSEAVGIVAFIAFALVCAAALVYESIGVQQAGAPPVPSLEPITYYVRCAIYFDKAGWSHGALTYLVVLSLSVLVGHWLWAWHPADELDDAATGDGG